MKKANKQVTGLLLSAPPLKMLNKINAKVEYVSFLKKRNCFLVAVKLLNEEIEVGSILELTRSKIKFRVTGTSFISPNVHSKGIRELMLRSTEDGDIIENLIQEGDCLVVHHYKK